MFIRFFLLLTPVCYFTWLMPGTPASLIIIGKCHCIEKNWLFSFFKFIYSTRRNKSNSLKTAEFSFENLLSCRINQEVSNGLKKSFSIFTLTSFRLLFLLDYIKLLPYVESKLSCLLSHVSDLEQGFLVGFQRPFLTSENAWSSKFYLEKILTPNFNHMNHITI